MLELNVPALEIYDEDKECFMTLSSKTLVLEHSLLSLEKWEMKWKKPLLYTIEHKEITPEQLIDYVRCMTINKVDPVVYNQITPMCLSKILDYMNDSMTATTIKPKKRSGKRAPIYTNEVIYAYMIEAGIPFECAKWHINRLLMLLQVCSELGTTSKRTKNEIMEEYSALNAKRREQLGTRG